MKPERLNAFSDGVIAIIVTIMVLELKPPQGVELTALGQIVPPFLSYVLSFTYVAIYWNNHHHLLHALPRVTGGILWANIHLLFWLSLIPVATAWMGDHYFAPFPTAVYGVALLMPAIAYYILQTLIVRQVGPQSHLAKALGADVKGKISPLFYLAGVASAFWQPWISNALYAAVALMWLVPDPRIERAVTQRPEA